MNCLHPRSMFDVSAMGGLCDSGPAVRAVPELRAQGTVLYCTVLYCTVLSYVPKVLLALIIPMFDDVYHKVAVWLNDMGE